MRGKATRSAENGVAGIHGDAARLDEWWSCSGGGGHAATGTAYGTTAIDFGLLLLISAVVVIAVPAVGTVLTLALVVAPAGAARLWTDRIATMTAVAVSIAVASTIGGLLLSRTWDVAAGAAISLTATTCSAVSMLVGSRHSLLARWLHRRHRVTDRAPLETGASVVTQP
ncbi:metal ABC transporter permease [Dactylosporangium sp. NPDC000521]|uniref:metal ABC transporter permease n=1 Tax=Dactylosporangium sp. NPDC000521 TaxID=3363975 RepID=UPI00367EBFD9